jgi:L-alanine-DL-glutamate epimerase-like enolase superfamily enzyme
MSEPLIRSVEPSAYRIPTESPESDGTLQWEATVLVLVEIACAGMTGVGYTYADAAAADLIREKLAPIVSGREPFDIPALWRDMRAAVRNIGRAGIASTAISAVDIALWDLKAKLLEQPLVKLLGRVRPQVPVYGSGGFTSYSKESVEIQLDNWAEAGIRMVKMKIGREPDEDYERVSYVHNALPPSTELFVDANGAYHRRQALAMARKFADCDVRWYEEPVTSDDLEGLRWLRDRCPADMAVAAGEYGFEPRYFRRMLEAQAVDFIMPDVTRCGGITGYLDIGALAAAFNTPVSSHCAPSLGVQVGCAVRAQCHLEYFYDHARIEQALFDGAPRPKHGCLAPDLGRPGLGLAFKHQDAARYAV